MQTQQLISADEFCLHYRVEHSFINALHQVGLIEVTTIEQSRFIDTERLHDLEKFVRLHYDMDINLEGIEAISYLLQKVEDLQEQINELKNKINAYRGDMEIDFV